MQISILVNTRTMVGCKGGEANLSMNHLLQQLFRKKYFVLQYIESLTQIMVKNWGNFLLRGKEYGLIFAQCIYT